jgi:hypothetical protein
MVGSEESSSNPRETRDSSSNPRETRDSSSNHYQKISRDTNLWYQWIKLTDEIRCLECGGYVGRRCLIQEIAIRNRERECFFDYSQATTTGVEVKDEGSRGGDYQKEEQS